ncbi:MAG: helix-turn-helix domain-containing protein [Halobacteria archaeon]
MRRSEIRIIEVIHNNTMRVTEVAEEINKSQSWTSELIKNLEQENLVEKNSKIRIADSYKATLLKDLVDRYDLKKVLAGKNQEILGKLLHRSESIADLELQGFKKSTLYSSLNQLRSVGAVEKTGDSYSISDDTLETFLEAQKSEPFKNVYKSNGERVIQKRKGKEIKDNDRLENYQWEEPYCVPTAFSNFQRYGVDYYPKDEYIYQGESDQGREQTLIHAVLCAENRKQIALSGIFFLTHRSTLESNELWRLAGKWDCVEKWADIIAFIDQRSVQQDELFPSWNEFIEQARNYGVYPRKKHPERSLLEDLAEVGEIVTERVDCYLLGGANLILRGLKDSTKDIDVVLWNNVEFRRLVAALRELGYEERKDLENTYSEMNPSDVLEKEGFPRWDIFVEVVADALTLTDLMKNRSDMEQEFGNLHVHLLSMTDMFLFKSVTSREGDLEDAALIARQGNIDWKRVLREVEKQEEISNTYFSFSVLDTLDLLVERHGIEVPIREKLASHCLRRGLILTLDEPKTIDDLREDVEFPDHRIYNKLRKLEKEGLVEVDRSGKLNEYRAVEP